MIKVSDIIQVKRYLLKRLKRKRLRYTLLENEFTVYNDFKMKGEHVAGLWYNTKDKSTHLLRVYFKIVNKNQVKQYLRG